MTTIPTTDVPTILTVKPQARQLTLNVQRQPTQQPLNTLQNTPPNTQPVLQAFQSAEVAGVITSVNFPKHKTDPTTFKVHCPNIGKTFDGVCDLFCPIRQGDTIYALCRIGPDMKLYVSKPPFVQPAIDRDSMIQCFMRAMKQGYGPTVRLYSLISRIAGGDDAVIPFLSGISQSWNDTHNADILLMFPGIEPEDIKKLISWWYRERNLRRLYLFGLTKKEVNACRMTCDQIYLKCMDNPYTVPAIPLDKCDAILDRLNKKPDPVCRIRGAIIRMLWDNLHQRAWIGTPTRILSKQFPKIKEHVEALKAEYGLVAELETAYLSFPHKVETWVANYLIAKVKQDKIKYDMPLDEAITLEDGTVITRHSAHFTRELSEDQKRAVQGALDHTVCIVTGAAGTGKTVVLGQILHNLELRGIPYAVCSFTGKAVARIREVTKRKNPATMHRLIANKKTNQLDKRSTQYEKEIPLAEYKDVTIDEISMVTEELFYDFVQAHPNVERWVFVGDVNQLQPIGWGSLFQQLVKSETIPTYRLVTNYRVYCSNGERDGIILNANAIINHDPQYPFEFIETSNFSVMEGPIERVFDIVTGCFSAGIKAEQIVILSPYNRPLDVLNRTFQSIYDVGARSIIDSRGVKWMIGDRVMMTENDNEIGVANGESGTVRDITNEAILIDFGNSGCHEFLLEPTTERMNYQQGTANQYRYRGGQADEVFDGDEGDYEQERTVKRLQHSYAISVDKSQGSEYDFVILYIDEFNTGSFLCKNRIYTAWTRSKRMVWSIVTDIDAFAVACVKSPGYRCDNLARRLTAELPNLKPFKITAPIPELEMNGDMPTLPDMPADAMDNGFDCDDFE